MVVAVNAERIRRLSKSSVRRVTGQPRRSVSSYVLGHRNHNYYPSHEYRSTAASPPDHALHPQHHYALRDNPLAPDHAQDRPQDYFEDRRYVKRAPAYPGPPPPYSGSANHGKSEEWLRQEHYAGRREERFEWGGNPLLGRSAEDAYHLRDAKFGAGSGNLVRDIKSNGADRSGADGSGADRVLLEQLQQLRDQTSKLKCEKKEAEERAARAENQLKQAELKARWEAMQTGTKFGATERSSAYEQVLQPAETSKQQANESRPTVGAAGTVVRDSGVRDSGVTTEQTSPGPPTAGVNEAYKYLVERMQATSGGGGSPFSASSYCSTCVSRSGEPDLDTASNASGDVPPQPGTPCEQSAYYHQTATSTPKRVSQADYHLDELSDNPDYRHRQMICAEDIIASPRTAAEILIQRRKADHQTPPEHISHQVPPISHPRSEGNPPRPHPVFSPHALHPALHQLGPQSFPTPLNQQTRPPLSPQSQPQEPHQEPLQPLPRQQLQPLPRQPLQPQPRQPLQHLPRQPVQSFRTMEHHVHQPLQQGLPQHQTLQVPQQQVPQQQVPQQQVPQQQTVQSSARSLHVVDRRCDSNLSVGSGSRIFFGGMSIDRSPLEAYAAKSDSRRYRLTAVPEEEGKLVAAEGNAIILQRGPERSRYMPPRTSVKLKTQHCITRAVSETTSQRVSEIARNLSNFERYVADAPANENTYLGSAGPEGSKEVADDDPLAAIEDACSSEASYTIERVLKKQRMCGGC